MKTKNPTLQDGISQRSRLPSTSRTSHTEDSGASPEIKRPREGTQIATVIETLELFKGQWVGVDVLMKKARCAATHSAVATLRSRYGFNIKNRQERVEGVCHSFYRLEETL